MGSDPTFFGKKVILLFIETIIIILTTLTAEFSDKQFFHHWVKADVHYSDYPYSKFNIKPEIATYTDEEYETFLQVPDWNRSETDYLMHLCYKYDLRWPVIIDRYSLIPSRTTEDLQHRFYSIVTKLKAKAVGATDVTMRNEAHSNFDVEYERCRRMQLEILFRKYLILLLVNFLKLSIVHQFLFCKVSR
jgi:DNA methyltransferase 1-associated protein 1